MSGMVSLKTDTTSLCPGRVREEDPDATVAEQNRAKTVSEQAMEEWLVMAESIVLVVFSECLLIL